MLRIQEQLFSLSVLLEISRPMLIDHEERSIIRDARRLPHVVCHDYDRIPLLQFQDQLLYPPSCNGIQSRGRFIHENHLRGDRYGTCYAESLLLTSTESQCILFEFILHLVPQGSLYKALLHQLIEIASISVDSCTPGNILVDALRKRVRFLKDHTYLSPNQHGIHIRTVQLVTVEGHRALNPRSRYHIVHTVQTSEYGTFPTPRGSYECSHVVFIHRK